MITTEHQPGLFALEAPPPATCIVCGEREAVAEYEAATFTDKAGGTPCVSVHWQCDACGSNSLTLRVQESLWIRRVWGLR